MKPNLTHLVFTLSLLCFGLTAHAEIYKWTDADGKVHYSQTPPQDQKAKVEDIGNEISMAAGTAGSTTDTTEEKPSDSNGEMDEARKQGKKNILKHNAFCEQQEAALKQLLSNPVIRWKSKDEEKILTAKERESKIAEFEQNIKKLCNPEILGEQNNIDAM